MKTIGLMHNFIILANCWSMSKVNVKCMEFWCPQSGPSIMVQCKVFLQALQKRFKKGQDQYNRSCAQLHHPSQLMKSCPKVNVKGLNELWCPQSNPRPIVSYRRMLRRMHRWLALPSPYWIRCGIMT